MESSNIFSILVSFALSTLAAYVAYRVYLKVKVSGVEDDMAFRLIWLIVSLGTLYAANLFREQISKHSTNEFIFQGLSGIIILVGLYSAFVLFITIKRKLTELGTTKIWKKLLYSAVISTIAAWGSTFFGITEAITLAKVAIGGVVIFSIQLLG